MIIEVPQISYFQRVKICLKRMPPGDFFWHLAIFTIGFPFIGNFIDNYWELYWKLYIPLLFFYTVFFYLIPRVRMARKYTKKIELKDGNILITYYKFNKKKEIHITNRFLTVQDYEGVGPFAIDFFDGKIYKRIFRQYKFGAWAKEENITALKKMIDPSWTQDTSKLLGDRSHRHPWRD